jgi:MFS family permease
LPTTISTTTKSSKTVVFSPNTAIRRLQAITFLYVFSSAVTSLAPAPALMAQLGSAKASTVLSLLSSGAALTEIIAAPWLGALLDRTGRRQALAAAVTVVPFAYAMVALRPTVWTLCVAKWASLLAFAVFTLTAQAMVSDCSQRVGSMAQYPNKNNKQQEKLGISSPDQWLSATIGTNMAIVTAAFFLSIVAAGVLADRGLTVVYGTSAMLGGLTAFATWIVVPETFSPSEQHSTTHSTPSSSNPLSAARLLFRHGSKVRVLAILLLLLTLPMNQGDMFQVFSRNEWKLDTKSFSSYLGLYGLLGIFSNAAGSMLIPRVGTKSFTLIAILSRIFSIVSTILFGYQGAIVGVVIGVLGIAQTIGIVGALVAAGAQTGLPQGQLAGERSALLALLKVVGPFIYTTLYLEGLKLGLPALPFFFNLVVSFTALVVAALYM